MDREQALAELSTLHAVALRLHDAGAGEVQIGEALGIPPQGVPRLLEVAQAKLAVVLAEAGARGRGAVDRGMTGG